MHAHIYLDPIKNCMQKGKTGQPFSRFSVREHAIRVDTVAQQKMGLFGPGYSRIMAKTLIRFAEVTFLLDVYAF
jgi:hypothetical protein